MYIDTNFDEIARIISIIIIIAIPLAVAQITLMVTALVSISRKNLPAKEKTGWILLVVLVSMIGPIFYFVVGSKELDEEAARYKRNIEEGNYV
jgi:uncharacterized membrane protein (UPF0182 family)